MKKLIYVLIMFCSSLSYGQSLENYLKLAVDSNPGLKSVYHEFEAALQKIPQVKALPDPTLSASAFGQMIETRVGPQQAIFILNQMFPWFGTLKYQGEAMSLMAESKFQEWIDERNELIYKVKAAWYPLYELKEIITYQNENREILESYKTLALSRFQNGSGTMIDVIRTEIMLSDITTELQLLEDKRKPLLSQFNTLLNRNLSSSVDIVNSLDLNLSGIQFSTDSLLQNNPKLIELDKKITAWKAQGIVARKQGMPKLGLGLNYTAIAKRENMDFPDNGKDAIMPMVSISLPIHRKKYRAGINEAEQMQSAMQEMKKELSNTLLSSYDMSTYEMQKAQEEYNLFKSQLEKTEQLISLLLTSYSNSGKDFEEVLRMQQLSLKYQISTAAVIKSYYTAKAKLEYLTAKN